MHFKVFHCITFSGGKSMSICLSILNIYTCNVVRLSVRIIIYVKSQLPYYIDLFPCFVFDNGNIKVSVVCGGQRSHVQTQCCKWHIVMNIQLSYIISVQVFINVSVSQVLCEHWNEDKRRSVCPLSLFLFFCPFFLDFCLSRVRGGSGSTIKTRWTYYGLKTINIIVRETTSIKPSCVYCTHTYRHTRI